MLIALALAFAVISGVNDGGAMLAAGLKAPGLRVITAVAVLAVALAVTPLVLGTAVAATLATGLVETSETVRTALLAAAAVAAIGVVTLLSARGLPTSLTLAMVGGIIGAGLGSALPVSWGTVIRVIVIGLAAPAVGAALGRALARWPLWLSGGKRQGERLAPAHIAGFTVQSIAYAANDGQKMFVLLGVAAAAGTPEQPTAWQLIAVAVLFALGTLLGVRPAAKTLGSGVLRGSPRDAITAELSASAAVLGSAALGVPVSMTQSVSGALIGAGLHRGYRQVRWAAALRLALAWMLTLPASAALGALVAVIGGVGG